MATARTVSRLCATYHGPIVPVIDFHLVANSSEI